ncbi:hypothetical protein AMTR_s05669p00006410 [Amborella trichopoda]|uniref:Uncharacterized protein n=1 Tax=Amborella trichopoda TaxID=13333 RepID=U5CUG6_AMBTC|nr:hypothetical protein AMTR_s05669p00006410 [Amborella trichopoda]
MQRDSDLLVLACNTFLQCSGLSTAFPGYVVLWGHVSVMLFCPVNGASHLSVPRLPRFVSSSQFPVVCCAVP